MISRRASGIETVVQACAPVDFVVAGFARSDVARSRTPEARSARGQGPRRAQIAPGHRLRRYRLGKPGVAGHDRPQRNKIFQSCWKANRRRQGRWRAHRRQRSLRQAFVIVNCGAIRANLVESILLATKVLTGANSGIGKFMEADAARCFWTRSATALEVGRFCALSSRAKSRPSARACRTINVRPISATNKDLIRSEAGRFARISIIASTSFRSPCRRCAGAGRHSASGSGSSNASRQREDRPFAESAPRDGTSRPDWRATSASWKAIFRAVVLSQTRAVGSGFRRSPRNCWAISRRIIWHRCESSPARRGRLPSWFL